MNKIAALQVKKMQKIYPLGQRECIRIIQTLYIRSKYYRYYDELAIATMYIPYYQNKYVEKDPKEFLKI